MTITFALDRTIHLCIDMQQLFAEGGLWQTPWMDRVLPEVVALSEAFGTRNLFTRFIPPMTADDCGGMWKTFYRRWDEVTRSRLPPSQLELMLPLQFAFLSGQVFDKSGYSAFFDGQLHRILQGIDVSTLVVTGAEMDVCVLSSVLAAVDCGYRVILVEDALCSSSDTGHDALLTMYLERLSLQLELARTRDILAALKG